MSPGAAGSGEGAGRAMARAGLGRAGGVRRGPGQRRPPTWEISDSDAEGPAGAETPARARDPAGERRPAAEALRRLRPGQAVPPEVWAEDEPHVLRLLEPEEFVRGVVQLTQVCGPTCSMPWVTPESPGCLHLAVIGLDTYLWSQQPTAQETQQPEHPAVTCTEAAVGWPEVEEALVHLQLWANVDVLLVASWQELSQHVCAFTKALAQRPFKQARESGAFPFCTSGRWTAGERVARDGMGLRGAWWRQVRQFNRVSPAVADAVVSAFPSPRLLQQAYEACGTEQERLALLADLPVKTGKRAPPRRVGPDLSRRICLFLTTTDPDLLLDLGS
ncbi:hypothetical protein JEQ12_012208 [Ovis aries]|uniref:Structure-specific endonuclease subunit EME2 n=1 Tax=Ovis aries TaxID=9940 RepID=A0A836CRH9_SHEEP|nr:hypothetical protein JEQ12_012208 [Ovis aries]